MLSTRHAVAFAYSRAELEALFRTARAHDVEQGGPYDARSAAINVWSHHWGHAATEADSEILGTFYVTWEPPAVWQIQMAAGFALEDLLVELGRLELRALGRVIHGDIPPRGDT